MAAATTTSPSTWQVPTYPASRTSRALQTPRTTSAGQKSPQVSPTSKNSQVVRPMKSPSPNYFGFIVGEQSIPNDSAPGNHVRQNWHQSIPGHTKKESGDGSNDFDSFRQQSERSMSFALSNFAVPRQASADLTAAKNIPLPETPALRESGGSGFFDQSRQDQAPTLSTSPVFSNLKRSESPVTMTAAVNDFRNARMSLPANERGGSPKMPKTKRSETLPLQSYTENPAMASVEQIAMLMQVCDKDFILLDLRTSAQYAVSHIDGALNLCVPPLLLKRPAFTVQKLHEAIAPGEPQRQFQRWKQVKYIIAYDTSSSQSKEAVVPFNVLKKFGAEGWRGQGLVIKGGYSAFQKKQAHLLSSDSDRSSPNAADESSPANGLKLPVAGGCAMPATKNAANPFFNNIRQNMDLVGGVGQYPVKKPSGMKDSDRQHLPPWIRRAASDSDEGKQVSDKFLAIEKTEQALMQHALSASVSYGSPNPDRKKKVQVAGIEKGSKNRYNNIFPYEHSRVRLQNCKGAECDYVNASFVQATYSKRRYIATQAPVPATYEDFWRVVWQQNVKVIVMLTAEKEGGQKKSDPYWQQGVYGKMHVQLKQERTVQLDTRTGAVQKRPPLSSSNSVRQLPTTKLKTPQVEKTFDFASSPKPARTDNDEPEVVIRHLRVAHTAEPTQKPREVVQLHYSQWPDFGAPASPTAILRLVELVDKFQDRDGRADSGHEQEPIMVHCSAGCGRTGTFCTIDSVIDMLRQQRKRHARLKRGDSAMDVDSQDGWLERNDVDLIQKAVEDFRGQRLSMVQNLRQFVLCYESVVQWLWDESQRGSK